MSMSRPALALLAFGEDIDGPCHHPAKVTSITMAAWQVGIHSLACAAQGSVHLKPAHADPWKGAEPRALHQQVRRKAQDLRLNGARSSLSAAAQAVTGAVASKWSALWEGPPDAGRQVPAGNALGGSQPAVPPPQGLPDIERVQAAAEAVAEPVEPWSELQSAPAGAHSAVGAAWPLLYDII